MAQEDPLGEGMTWRILGQIDGAETGGSLPKARVRSAGRNPSKSRGKTGVVAVVTAASAY